MWLEWTRSPTLDSVRVLIKYFIYALCGTLDGTNSTKAASNVVLLSRMTSALASRRYSRTDGDCWLSINQSIDLYLLHLCSLSGSTETLDLTVRHTHPSSTGLKTFATWKFKIIQMIFVYCWPLTSVTRFSKVLCLTVRFLKWECLRCIYENTIMTRNRTER